MKSLALLLVIVVLLIFGFAAFDRAERAAGLRP